MSQKHDRKHFFRKILIVVHYIVQNWVSQPNIDVFRHPTWTYYKVFEKMPEKCMKNLRENYFSPLSCLIQKLDHNSVMQKIREKSLMIKSRGFFGRLEWENAGTGGGIV